MRGRGMPEMRDNPLGMKPSKGHVWGVPYRDLTDGDQWRTDLFTRKSAPYRKRRAEEDATSSSIPSSVVEDATSASLPSSFSSPSAFGSSTMSSTAPPPGFQSTVSSSPSASLAAQLFQSSLRDPATPKPPAPPPGLQPSFTQSSSTHSSFGSSTPLDPFSAGGTTKTTSQTTSSSAMPPNTPKSAAWMPRPYMPAQADAPKSALHGLYAAAPRRRPLSATDFCTWNNRAPPHLMYWTSCFVCPLTGEIFLTQPYHAKSDDYVTANGLCWYKRKANAEHGAAATAYDCCVYRQLWEQMGDTFQAEPVLLISALPYPASEGIGDRLPDAIEPSVQQEISSKRNQVIGVESKNHTGKNETSWEKYPYEASSSCFSDA